jgi:hypothetical protein
MGRVLTSVVGAALCFIGLIWILQGLNLLGGSGMSGHSIWAVIGLIIAATGVVLIVRTVRRPSA